MLASNSYSESQMKFCLTSDCVKLMPDGFVKIDGPTSLPQIRVSLITATINMMDSNDAF